eukprot:441446-Hanusia_phi.AAC.1
MISFHDLVSLLSSSAFQTDRVLTTRFLHGTLRSRAAVVSRSFTGSLARQKRIDYLWPVNSSFSPRFPPDDDHTLYINDLP